MPKFFSHAWQDQIIKQFGREKLVLVNGGINTLINKIEELAQ